MKKDSLNENAYYKLLKAIAAAKDQISDKDVMDIASRLGHDPMSSWNMVEQIRRQGTDIEPQPMDFSDL